MRSTNVFLHAHPMSYISHLIKPLFYYLKQNSSLQEDAPEGLILGAAWHHGSGVGSGSEPAAAVNIFVPLDALVAA